MSTAFAITIASALALVGCDLEGAREQRVERARVARAIENLQGAVDADKEQTRRALSDTACSSAETCTARDTCVRAYELLDRSKRAAKAANAALDLNVAFAAKATRSAEADAKQFKADAARCLEARHRLETADVPR